MAAIQARISALRVGWPGQPLADIGSLVDWRVDQRRPALDDGGGQVQPGPMETTAVLSFIADDFDDGQEVIRRAVDGDKTFILQAAEWSGSAFVDRVEVEHPLNGGRRWRVWIRLDDIDALDGFAGEGGVPDEDTDVPPSQLSRATFGQSVDAGPCSVCGEPTRTVLYDEDREERAHMTCFAWRPW